jgi:hypothetical protein
MDDGREHTLGGYVKVNLSQQRDWMISMTDFDLNLPVE